MYLYRIYENYLDSSKRAAAYRKDIEARAQKLIRLSATQSLADYPVIKAYLTSRFPKIDISSVPIYKAGPKAFKQCKWAHVGGFFIPWMSIIFVKDSSLGSEELPYARGRFEKELGKHHLDAVVEDVVVHECLHAISFKSGRSGSKHKHMEEEFVYTNCIDFYKQQGMSTDDIIEKNFLPFCMQDVLSSRKDWAEILRRLFESGVDHVDYWSLPESERKQFENQHAKFLASCVVEIAREKGKYMVECYNKYGQGVSLPSGDVTDKSVRFASINMDCDI